MFGSFARDLQKSLTLTTQRHALLTQNLANVNTPGYKRKDMDFGIVLEDEIQKGPEGIAKQQSSLGDDSGSDTSVRLDGNSVDLEREIMAMSETELHYQALIDVTSNYFNNLQTVIREGK
jgi:flagellar basal-body rod protein FlgB